MSAALKETDWEAIAHELLLMLSEHDTGANPLPRLIEQHSKKRENENDYVK